MPKVTDDPLAILRAWLTLSLERAPGEHTIVKRPAASGTEHSLLEVGGSPAPGRRTWSTLGLCLHEGLGGESGDVELVTYGPEGCDLSGPLFDLAERARVKRCVPVAGGAKRVFLGTVFGSRFPHATFLPPFPWHPTYEPLETPRRARLVYVAALSDAEYELGKRRGIEELLSRGSVAFGDPERDALV